MIRPPAAQGGVRAGNEESEANQENHVEEFVRRQYLIGVFIVRISDRKFDFIFGSDVPQKKYPITPLIRLIHTFISYAFLLCGSKIVGLCVCLDFISVCSRSVRHYLLFINTRFIFIHKTIAP